MAPIPVWPGEFVSLGDTQVYVRTAPATGASTTDANPAEQVVCVHGFGGSANNWTDLMALLSGATGQEPAKAAKAAKTPSSAVPPWTCPASGTPRPPRPAARSAARPRW